MKIIQIIYLILLSRLKQIVFNYYFVSFFILLVFWIIFIHYTPQGKATLDRNIFTGEVVLNKKLGINFTWPWIQSTKVDLRPTKYCIDCACSNMVCVLSTVNFDEEGLKEFIQQEGWSYYWLRNRISFNLGHKMEWRGFESVIRGYSFDETKEWKFIQKNKNI
jgi:hypothetical protein